MARLLLATPGGDGQLDLRNVEIVDSGRNHSTQDLRRGYADGHMQQHKARRCLVIQLNHAVEPEHFGEAQTREVILIELPAALRQDGEQ